MSDIFVVHQRKHEHLFHAGRVCRCGASSWAVAKLIGASGQVKFPWFCRACGWLSNIYEPKHERLIYEAVVDRSPERCCERCGKYGAEEHHWAPTHRFGESADQWPVSYLCPECHAEWHRIMDPPRHVEQAAPA